MEGQQGSTAAPLPATDSRSEWDALTAGRDRVWSKMRAIGPDSAFAWSKMGAIARYALSSVEGMKNHPSLVEDEIN